MGWDKEWEMRLQTQSGADFLVTRVVWTDLSILRASVSQDNNGNRRLNREATWLRKATRTRAEVLKKLMLGERLERKKKMSVIQDRQNWGELFVHDTDPRI